MLIDSTIKLIVALISSKLFWVLSASFLTSSATTANLPCSPALAASIAAFSASKLVYSTISLITSKIVLACSVSWDNLSSWFASVNSFLELSSIF